MRRKPVLVDTSIWIGYFRSNEHAGILARLFEEDRVVINDVILAELLPAMNLYAKKVLIERMRVLERIPVFVNWEGLIGLQTTCLKHGLNGVGLPDLMVIQTALEHKLPIFSADKHFERASRLLKFEIFVPS